MVLDTVDFRDYSISVFMSLLIKLSHCRQTKIALFPSGQTPLGSQH